MSVSFDKATGRWRYEFDRVIPGRGRIRARKRLPREWSREQAEAFDRSESARLYAIATGASDPPAARIEQAVALYLTERGPELKQRKRIAQELAIVREHYAGRTLDELPAVCAKLRKHSEAAGLKPATIRNRIRYLTSACRWGWKHHGLSKHDPAARVVVPQVKNERRVYLTRDQLLFACRQTSCRETRRLARIAFYTGMRAGEIFDAKLDLEAGVFVLADSKNGEPRLVPIDSRIASACRALPLTWSRTTLMKRWRLARDAAGLRYAVFHDLRHSTASELINAGETLSVVGSVLGHKSVQSTNRYAHMLTETKRVAMGKIGRRRA